MAYSQDTIISYKKRVLESVEVDLLASYYSQDGDNAAVTGGIGTEELTDLASSIVVSIPLNDDAILKISVESRSEKNLVAMDSRSEELKNGEILTVQKADYKISIVQLKNQSFVNSLRNKLNWGLDQRNS